MAKVVGIDLGTTNSVVSVIEGKEAKVIPNAHGSNLTPSMVAFTEKGEKLVGILAKRQAITNPKNTVFEVKRLMGRRANEVIEERKRVPYEVVGEGDEPIRIRISGKLFTPQEISAMILQDLKQSAENYLSMKITDAVITCPAYFNDSQRQATKEAGAIAGFNVRRVFNEPTASSLAYGLDKKVTHRIGVYDLGGGTFDISILEVDNEVIQVLSTNGNSLLGGTDFDERLIQYVVEEFKKEQGIDLRKDPMALQRLKEACEKAKCELSTMLETEINLPFITADQTGPKHLSIKLTRAKLEQLIGDLIDKTIQPVEQALVDAKLSPKDIHEVVLVGGSTRIPKVQKLVQDIFSREPHKGVNPDEVVAVGAAIQAGILGGEMKDILLLDVTPLTLGVETLGGIRTPLVKRNTTIPVKKSEIFSTAQDSQTQVEIHVVQGEREMAADCRTLGRFILDGIPPAPRGVPKIEVTFEIDANGILNVKAKDLATNKEQSIIIKASTGLSEEEIERMVKEAQQYEKEDKKRRELVEARNQADHLIYNIEKMLKEHADKVSDDQKKNIRSSIDKLRKIMEKDSADDIKYAMEELSKVSYELSKKMYEEAAKKGPREPKEPRQEKKKDEGGENIVDAEFETK
jgi:molecular chaperone DnaK